MHWKRTGTSCGCARMEAADVTALILIGALGLALASIVVLCRVDSARHKKRQHEALRSFYER